MTRGNKSTRSSYLVQIGKKHTDPPLGQATVQLRPDYTKTHTSVWVSESLPGGFLQMLTSGSHL